MSTTPKTGSRTDLLVFADYNNFELRDAQARDDLATVDDVVAALLADFIAAIVPGSVSVGTARRVTGPVSIELVASAPTKDDLTRWDHVAEASLELLTAYSHSTQAADLQLCRTAALTNPARPEAEREASVEPARASR